MNSKTFNKYVHRIFICVMLVSILSGVALADAIWEPNDDFYMSNAEKCQLVNRDYYANGTTGYLEIFKKPGGASLGFVENGKLFHIQFSYESDGEAWGSVEYKKENDKLFPSNYDSEASAGWVNMSELILKYDYLEFENEFGSSFVPYSGDYSALKNAEKVVMWTFPGSGETIDSIEGIEDDFAVGSVYTDPSGTQWGYVGYYYGMKNFWICMDDPANENLPATITQEIALNLPINDSKPEKSSDLTTIVVVCVSAVVLISALLVALMRKKVKS